MPLIHGIVFMAASVNVIAKILFSVGGSVDFTKFSSFINASFFHRYSKSRLSFHPPCRRLSRLRSKVNFDLKVMCSGSLIPEPDHQDFQSPVFVFVLSDSRSRFRHCHSQTRNHDPCKSKAVSLPMSHFFFVIHIS